MENKLKLIKIEITALVYKQKHTYILIFDSNIYINILEVIIRTKLRGKFINFSIKPKKNNNN